MTTKVRADPTKAFFVRTITRDISLEDCILDLIDNSLDGARELLGSPEPSLTADTDFSKFQIDVAFSGAGFSIEDNCGGISLDDAVNYAFTFGRRDEDEPDAFSIGVYGIGMKRAVFKLGSEVLIHSTYIEKAKPNSFSVPINVTKWLKDPEWDFYLEPASDLPRPGVRIVVEELNEDIAAEFENPAFEAGLRRILSRDYSRFVEHGLTINVNGKTLRPFEFQLLAGGDVQPIRAEFRAGDVRIEIIAGMAAPPSESLEPDEDGPKEDRSGWYVLCNDRIVLAADKSEITGWGYNGRSRWHPQYRGFIGLVLFSAKSADALPLTTTKRNIDREKAVYRQALARMMEITKVWIDYTNKRKVSATQAKSAEAAAKYVPAFHVDKNTRLSLPTLTADPSRKEVTIQYSKLHELVKQLAVGMGDASLSAREVGSKAFDYAYGEMVGDQE